MTEEQIDRLITAIEKVANALDGIGNAMAEDEPLNYSLSRGLNKIAEAIDYGRAT